MNNPIFAVTALDIIKKALSLVNERDANQELEPTDAIDTLQSLNFMVKAWQSQGLHLWTKTEGVLFLNVGQESYKLGPTGDEAANLDDTVFTTTGTAAVITDRNLALASTVGMAGADDVLPFDPGTTTQNWTVNAGTIDASTGSLVLTNGVSVAADIIRTLDDLTVGTTYQVLIDYTLGTSSSTIFEALDGITILGTVTLSATGTGFLEFTAPQTSVALSVINGTTTTGETSQINSIQLLDETTGDFLGVELDDGSRQFVKIVNVNSVTQVFTTAGLTDDAAVGNTVVAFPELINRPIDMLDLRRATTTNSNSEIQAIKWSREQYFAQPDRTSQGTINIWYYSPQLIDGRLYLWQTANNVNQLAKFTFIRPIEITETTADAPDFPSEWFYPLAYSLAVLIGPEYRQPPQRLAQLKGIADEMLQDVLGHDQEESSINIQPDFRGF